MNLILDWLWDWLKEQKPGDVAGLLAVACMWLCVLAPPLWRGAGRAAGLLGGVLRALTPQPSEALQAILTTLESPCTRLVDGRLCHPRLLVEFPEGDHGRVTLYLLRKGEREDCTPYLNEAERYAVSVAARGRRDDLRKDAREMARWALVRHLDVPAPGRAADKSEGG